MQSSLRTASRAALIQSLTPLNLLSPVITVLSSDFAPCPQNASSDLQKQIQRSLSTTPQPTRESWEEDNSHLGSKTIQVRHSFTPWKLACPQPTQRTTDPTLRWSFIFQPKIYLAQRPFCLLQWAECPFQNPSLFSQLISLVWLALQSPEDLTLTLWDSSLPNLSHHSISFRSLKPLTEISPAGIMLAECLPRLNMAPGAFSEACWNRLRGM